jgi:hypothetical protein
LHSACKTNFRFSCWTVYWRRILSSFVICESLYVASISEGYLHGICWQFFFQYIKVLFFLSFLLSWFCDNSAVIYIFFPF